MMIIHEIAPGATRLELIRSLSTASQETPRTLPQAISAERRTRPALAAGPFVQFRLAPSARRLAWPLAVLLLTPLILAAGIAALVGTVALGAGRRLRPRGDQPSEAKLVTVLRLEAGPAADAISRAA